MANLNRSAVLATALGMVLLLSVGAPASAFQIMDSSGPYGDFGYLPADDSASPAGKCGYSDVLADNYAHLRWVKVRGPEALARDVTPGRDQQKTSWQLRVQRQQGGGAWKTVAKSAVQSRTAYDDQSAAFDPIKVYVKGSADQLWRGIVLIKWWRNGAVEAWVKLRIEYYGVKWTVGTPDYVFTDACTGVAD